MFRTRSRALPKPTSRSARRRSAPPGLDRLDDRCPPSGTVPIASLQGPPTLPATVPGASEGQLASPSLNATFTDTNAVTPANLTVTVNYGDGTPLQSNQSGANFDPNL